MTELSNAYSLRSDLIKQMSGGALVGFSGTGFREDAGKFFKKGVKRFKPIAFNALKSAVEGFTKGFAENQSQDLGAKALSGLAQAGKQAGISLAGDIKKELGGGMKGGQIAPMQKSKPRPIIGKKK